MTKFEIIISFLNCIASIGAIVTSFIALKIAYQATILNSRHYIPRLKIKFIENGIAFKNRDSNLFEIFKIDIIIIIHTGFVDYATNAEVDMSFVTVNRSFGDYELEIPLRNYKNLIYKDGDDSFSPEEINQKIYEGVKECLNEKYDIDSKIGRAFPYFNGSVYYVKVTYRNRYGEYDDYIMKRIPSSRGAGEIRKVLSLKEYDSELSEYHKIPTFESVEQVFEYYLERSDSILI